jgi:hypothetical protein
MKKGFFTTIAAFMLAFSLHAQSTTAPSVAVQETERRTVAREMEKTINGKKWELSLQNDEVAEVKVDGQTLPKSTWTKYQAEIEDLRSSAYALDANMSTPNGNSFKIQEYNTTDGGLTPEHKATQNALEESMLGDGLIKTRSYKLVLTEKAMVLDEKTLSKATRDKYIAIYYTYSGETKCEGCTFKFQVNRK